MSKLSKNTYLGIAPGQDTQEIPYYLLADKLIGEMLHVGVQRVEGKHTVPYAIGKNALHPLLGVFKSEMAGVPITTERTRIEAHLTGGGRQIYSHGLQFKLARISPPSFEEPSIPPIGTLIHHEKDAPQEHMDQLRDLLIAGLPQEIGYTALYMDIRPEQGSTRACTLRGQLEGFVEPSEVPRPGTIESDANSQILPFTEEGAVQLVQIVATALRSDLYRL